MKHLTQTTLALSSSLAMSFPGLTIATGFTDLATCFTAKKGDNNAITDFGECRLHFYSSAGGGTEINMLIKNRFKVHGRCPGVSANYGLTGCEVNGMPGEVRSIESDYGTVYCAWRHKDSIAYCAKPWNYRS